MKYLFFSLFALNFISAPIAESKEKITCDVECIKNVKTKESINEWLDGDFGLTPYRVNYILPFGYTSHDYTRLVPTDNYENVEAELQVSLKLKIGSGLFGLDERYYISYSHQAFWQVYAESSPFRETTYNPEVFVVFPFESGMLSSPLRSIKLAYAHKSNGQGNVEESAPTIASTLNLQNRSRSINYLYAKARFQHKALIVDFKVWYPLPEDDETNDNPDIMKYTGYSSVKLRYFMDENMFTLMTRANIRTKHGAVEGTYSYPIINDLYLYTKIFSGYGESLIDYDNRLTKYSIGFSFSR